MYDIAALPIILAGVANMVLGFIWYHPKVFGDTWATLAGLDKKTMEAGMKRMPLMALVGLFFAIVMSYVLAHFAIAWGVWDWIGAVELAFWLWLGFVVPPLLGPVLWEGKSVKFFAINAGYWLLGLATIAVVLVSMA